MTICIDAGHNISGADTGAVGLGGIAEGEITFDIASALGDALIRRGHQVVLTRPTRDTVLGTTVAASLAERVRISNEGSCELFISLHCNSATESAKGTEVLVSGREGKAEELGIKVAEEISTALAMVNRGVRVDTEYLGTRLYVLHNTLCPAILIELGFITNKDDANKLIARADEFAEAIASAVGGGSMPFTDIGSHWARDFITALADEGIVNGYDDGTFRPDAPITRAEAASMVYKAMNK